MEESEDNMSAEDNKLDDIPIKVKPKKRSLVERELETSLTAQVTSPLTNGDAASRSRYGRARRIKSNSEFCDSERNATKLHKSPKLDKSPSKVQSPAYKMHASNSPVRIETPKRDLSLENQIENIYTENISLSRFSSEEKACKSATKKLSKVYVRKDLIQSKDKEDDTVFLIKNMFSPSKSAKKPNHLSNYLERSSEKYDLEKPKNGYLNTSSVVKTLDFDGKKKKREEKKTVLSKSELFDLEAQCEYQVGDLAWARMGTYPFWPCIVTRDPLSGMFVKKKLISRSERDVLHVTFFGDNGRRGWIVGSMLRKFLGQVEFEAAKANFPPEAKKKDPRLHAAFFISEKKIPQWQISVDEAEMLLKEPKRLRIDILYDMLQKVRETKTTPKHEKSKTIVRASSDVSLSESLLDTLFSEDDSKGNDADRSRSKSRNRSFDVSEVVTACLDNMAAKTGITKIQRQSHMDRWLQKAKSKTPEKSHLKSLSLKIEKDFKVSNTAKCKRKLPKKSPASKHYNLKKNKTESQSEYKLLSHQNEHDYSLNSREINEPVLLDDIEIEYENAEMLTSDVIEPGSGLGFISKVETLCRKEQEDINDQNDVIMTVINDEFTISDENDIQNMNVGNQVGIQNNHGQSLDAENELVLEKRNNKSPPESSSKKLEIIEISNKIEPEITEVMETKNTNKYENNLETSSIKDSSIDLDLIVSHNNILNDARIDNETLDVYGSHVQTTNSESDNGSVTIVNQNDSLFDVAIETATVTVDQNNFVTSNIQDAGSKIDPDIHLNTTNELKYKNFTPDITPKIFDKNILAQGTIENEGVLKENIPQNKVLELNISTSSITTLPNVVTLKADGIKDFPDFSTKILDKNTSVQPSGMKENSLQNEVIHLTNYCSDTNITTLSTQSPEVFYVSNMKNYADDGIEDFPDTSKSTEKKTNSTENKTTNLSKQNLEVPLGTCEYVDDGIKGFPSEPEIAKKQSSPKSKTTKSNSNTENKLSKFLTVKELVDEGIEFLPEKSTNNLDKKIFEQRTPDSETALNLPLNKKFNLSNSTEDKLSCSITLCSEVSNVVHIEDYPDMSKNIVEKTTEEAYKDTLLKKTLLNDKELESNNSSTENQTANWGTRSNVANTKKYDIEDFLNVTTKNDEKSVISESKSLRQNHRERREFETQLYNIFGLSNKNSPKSKLNLSINKSCNNINSTDVVKIIDNNQIDYDVELECTQKNSNNKVINENALLNIIEVGSAEREISTEKEQSLDDLVNIEKEIITEQTPSLKMVNNKAEKNICAKETKRQSLDSQNSSVDTQKEKANFPKKCAIENDTEVTVVKVTEPIIEDDGDIIDAASTQVGKKSPQEINLPTDYKLSHDTREALKNPDFLKYLELRQDALIDEQPELTEVQITDYLFKTWLYEESLKTDIKKTDDIQNARLVNVLKHSPIKIKLSLNKSSKKHRKTYKVQITNDNENNGIPPVSIFDKKMKTDLNKVNKNKNADSISQSESSPKRSKRIKRNNHYSTSFQNYFLSSIKKDSFSNNILELIPKECNVQEKDNCQIKIEIDTNEDHTCKIFPTVSSKSPIQNGYKNVQIDKQLHSSENNDCIKKLSPKISVIVTQNVDNQGKLSPGNVSLDDEEPLAAHQLRLTLSKNQSACVADGEIIMEHTTDIKEDPEEDDTDNVSVKSESSESSTFIKKLHAKDKQSNDKRKPLEEPEFLKYLELNQDTLIDEHPELTLEEITNYLHKTWLYEESLKNDAKKADEEMVTNLVKGLNQDAAPFRRARKKRVEKDKQIDFNLNSEDMPRKEKSKRKIIRPYFYKEHFSDIEDDIEFFEIFRPTSNKSSKTGAAAPVSTETNKIEGVEEQSLGIQMMDVEVEFATNEIDEVEEYFRQLTVPKPNLFKGLLREKVCEICENGINLVKCKGCHCMFHVDCVRKKPEVVEATTSVRGRKKKKKPRGRKAKDHSNSLDSECHSDERSQDPNASDEMQNTSIENETEPIVIANADDFEAQMTLKLKELLENAESKEYESFSSADELDWNDTDYGECKVVDVLPRKKDREVDIDYSNFKCNNCEQYDIPVCFVCKSPVSPKDKAEHRQRCQVAHCHKYYHLECLDHWPQTQFNAGELSRINNSNQLVEALTCPRHVCHTCVCDDPRGCKTRFSGDKLARCVRCPATYHTFTKCLPAGTEILTGSHIICPRHYEHRPGKVPCHVNTGWCFICALGGTLICCEYCPTSFHAECLNIDPPEGGYMCEDCETGRLPLYGEMVWVKLGHYRWWPGIILHPSEIPQNILAVKHSLGEFVVRFFGQYDYYWVNRGRVFPFQEGDSGRISTQKTKIDAAFTMAMEHAQRACEILKTASPNEEESMDIASSLLPPHYVKLKVNKPCGSLCGKKIEIEESSLTQCECDPNELDPCGPYTQCLNRMLLTECGPTCRAGDRCNNRAFEKRLYPKMTPYRTPHRGWGLKTLEDIKAGQFVIEYVGELIDEEEFRRRMRRKYEVRDENFYYLTLDKERMIDAGPKGNLARFMNHSCEPNCETQKWTVLGDVRVGLFALYDIPANSELTFNYNLESTGIEKKQCMCGAKRCSGYIGEKPKQDDQPKKNKLGLPTKRTYKKRKNLEASPSPKPKQRVPRPYKPRELTEIEKDLLLIKTATNGVSSDSESSRLSIESKDSRGLKRKRTEDNLSPSTKKIKTVKLEVVIERDNQDQEV